LPWIAAVALAMTFVSPVARAQGVPKSGPALVSVAWLELRGAGSSERPRALESLLAAVQRRTSVEPDVANVPHLGPLDEALFEHPLVVLAGSARVEPLTDAELDALRRYLTSGGMLLIDDRSADPKSPFATSAREQISRVLGGRAFEPLRPDHAAYRSYYLLDRAWGRVDVSQDLEAILLGGRAAVVWSANDMLGAWERDALGQWAHDVQPGGVRQREMAVRAGVNLVLYALTLDYKEDLVHLPLILQRKR
jgi:ribosomal protein S9